MRLRSETHAMPFFLQRCVLEKNRSLGGRYALPTLIGLGRAAQETAAFGNAVRLRTCVWVQHAFKLATKAPPAHPLRPHLQLYDNLSQSLFPPPPQMWLTRLLRTVNLVFLDHCCMSRLSTTFSQTGHSSKVNDGLAQPLDEFVVIVIT